jgi:hypothetical protein
VKSDAAGELFKLVCTHRTRLLGVEAASVSALRLFEQLPRHPLVTVASAMKPLDLSERKHQNISAVLQKLGLPWIFGYKPLPNYQNSLIADIEHYLSSTTSRVEESPRTTISLFHFSINISSGAGPHPARGGARRRASHHASRRSRRNLRFRRSVG